MRATEQYIRAEYFDTIVNYGGGSGSVGNIY